MIMSRGHISPVKERNKVGWSCTCHAYHDRVSYLLLGSHKENSNIIIFKFSVLLRNIKKNVSCKYNHQV